MSNLLLSMLGAVGTFGQSIILERQREGIQIAKGEGKYKGRKPSLTVDRVLELQCRAYSGEKETSLAWVFGISPERVYPYLAAALMTVVVQSMNTISIDRLSRYEKTGYSILLIDTTIKSS